MSNIRSTHNNILSTSKNRLLSLDFMKAASILSVVSFHSILVSEETYIDSRLAIGTIFAPLRFCVPVFLTISFLLLEKSLAQDTDVSKWSIIKKRLLRLLVPTLFWFGTTALLKYINKNSWYEIAGSILNGEVFTGGYFLLVLLQFYIVFAVLRTWFQKPKNVFIACVIQTAVYVLIYSLHTRAENSIVINILLNIHRPFFIYWFVYPALGIFAYRKWSSIVKLSSQLSFQIKALIIFTYILIQCSESYYQSLILPKVPPFDYSMFSCILSVPVMLVCFAAITEDNLHPLITKIVKILSKYSLGIFCVNGILYQIFYSIGLKKFSEANFNLIQMIPIKLITWIILLAVSLLISILLERIYLKKVVC